LLLVEVLVKTSLENHWAVATEADTKHT
jgi:hypothetical protein